VERGHSSRHAPNCDCGLTPPGNRADCGGVTPEEVERAAQRDLAAIRRERKAGKLKPWNDEIRAYVRQNP
jgi:hypothetical protein